MSNSNSFFSNQFETNLSEEINTKTHVYGNDYHKVKEMIIMIGKKLGYDVKNIDDKYCEILLCSRLKGDIIVTINANNYYEQQVDFKINTHYLFPFGRTKKIAINMFEELNKHLVLKY